MSDEINPQLSKIIEGAILAAGEPLSVVKLQALFDEEGVPEKEAIEQALQEIKKACEERGFDLVEVASGWRFQVREDLAQWVNRLWEEKPQKYSRALLETMALIAYRQPLTRGDIEEVRGVAVSSHIIKTLTERGWVKVVGHRDVPGRPALYATTKGFLDYFNLKSLDELPSLGELKDIESLNQDLEFGILEPAAAADEHSEEGENVIATESAFDGENDEEADTADTDINADDSEAAPEDEAAADPVLEESSSEEQQKDGPERDTADQDQADQNLTRDEVDTEVLSQEMQAESDDADDERHENSDHNHDSEDASPASDTERLND